MWTHLAYIPLTDVILVNQAQLLISTLYNQSNNTIIAYDITIKTACY